LIFFNNFIVMKNTKKLIQDLKVIKNKQLNQDNYLLELEAKNDFPDILPGQFVEVLVDDAANTFLRRPFSIHDVDKNKKTISLFVKIVGEGTRTLCEIKEGRFVNLIYPLGNSFSITDDKNVLLIGGGCGIAPLLYLAKYLFNENIKPVILIGAKSKNDILQVNEYKKYGEVFLTTEDGSIGEKGLVINHSILNSKSFNFSKIYCCGPELMMKAVAKYSKEKNIDCEVSLENTMACGIGACLCCVTETIHGNKCVCTDGPVFNIKELKW